MTQIYLLALMLFAIYNYSNVMTFLAILHAFTPDSVQQAWANFLSDVLHTTFRPQTSRNWAAKNVTTTDI